MRAIILGEELLRLPVEFRAFVARVSSFIDQTEGFISEQRQFNAEQRQFNAEQRQFNAEQGQFNADQRQFNAGFMRRLDRIEGDIGKLRDLSPEMPPNVTARPSLRSWAWDT